MRRTPLVLAAVALLAALATIIPFMQTEAHGADTDCSAAACADAGQARVLAHDVFSSGCVSGDLHVMRYVPAGASAPLAATWCD